MAENMRILITLTLFFCGNIALSQNQWTTKDSINGAPRSVSSAFVIYDEAYVVAGLDVDGFRRKMYSYTYWQDDWDDELSLGGLNGAGLNRGSASSFALNGKGYVCLGQGVTNGFFKDTWEYDPIAKTWTQKANFSGSARRQAVAFTISNDAYVGTGVDVNGFCKDFYKYSPATNSWTQISDFGGTARKEAVGISIYNRGYVGTGDDGLKRNDFWEYDANLDQWIQKANVPGDPRKGAVGWGIKYSPFIALGENNDGDYLIDVYEYDIWSNQWSQRADFIGSGRTSAVAFVVQDIAFVGTGYDGEFKDDFYAYRPLVGLNTIEKINAKFYPNPTNQTLYISHSANNLKTVIIDLGGKDVTSNFEISEQVKTISITKRSIQAGTYMVQLFNNENQMVFSESVIFTE